MKLPSVKTLLRKFTRPQLMAEARRLANQADARYKDDEETHNLYRLSARYIKALRQTYKRPSMYFYGTVENTVSGFFCPDDVKEALA